MKQFKQITINYPLKSGEVLHVGAEGITISWLCDKCSEYHETTDVEETRHGSKIFIYTAFCTN